MDVGTLVADRYLVQGRLARGGMAEVFAAHDQRLARDVALKVLRGAAGTDRARFDAEVRLLASLQHPHLVRVFDAGVQGDDPFLVLELAEGPNLAQLLAAGPLPEDRRRSLGRDVAAALAHVHAAGVVHRDVKPANVLTGADGRWLLADFGIARLVDATRLTATGAAVGTPAYLAPEQLTGEAATSAVDVYALGLTLLEAVTGRRAFPGDGPEAAMARLTQDPDVSAAPAEWQGLLVAMTARDPAARPSAAEVARRLGDDVGAAPTEPLPLPVTAGAVATATATMPIVEPAPAAAPVWGVSDRGPRPWVGVAAALVVLLLVAGAALAWLGDDGEATAATSTSTSTTAAPATATSAPPVTAAPAATAPSTVATTTPPTPADPCGVLQAQLDQLDQARAPVAGPGPRPGRGHGREHDDRHALDEQRRDLQHQLHEQHC